MAAQLQIDFESAYKTDADDPRLDTMLDYLNNRGWVNAREFKQRFTWSDRTTRMLAAASNGQILSGQQGYKLTRQATPEELHHATAWLDSQANEMSLRARAIRRVWHHSATAGK